MMALVDRALALNPSFARGWYISGVLRRWAGQPDIAIEHFESHNQQRDARKERQDEPYYTDEEAGVRQDSFRHVT